MEKTDAFSYEKPYMEVVLQERNDVLTLSTGENEDMGLWPGNGES